MQNELYCIYTLHFIYILLCPTWWVTFWLAWYEVSNPSSWFGNAFSAYTCMGVCYVTMLSINFILFVTVNYMAVQLSRKYIPKYYYKRPSMYKCIELMSNDDAKARPRYRYSDFIVIQMVGNLCDWDNYALRFGFTFMCLEGSVIWFITILISFSSSI